MLLYRPLGLNELRLAYDANMRAFPPRLPDQPIFYPVLTQGYAEQIARDWNTQTEPFAGYVTSVSVEEAYAAGFEPQQVGGRDHRELWVPADDLNEFNSHIETEIVVETAFFGSGFVGEIPERFLLANRSASAQLHTLVEVLEYNGMDFCCEVTANHRAIFLNFAYWLCCVPAEAGISDSQRQQVIGAIRKVWEDRKAKVSVPRDGRRAA